MGSIPITRSNLPLHVPDVSRCSQANRAEGGLQRFVAALPEESLMALTGKPSEFQSSKIVFFMMKMNASSHDFSSIFFDETSSMTRPKVMA